MIRFTRGTGLRGWAIAVLALTAALVAQPAAAACDDPGVATARILPAYRLDTPWYSGLLTAFNLGMLPATYPVKDIAGIKAPCRRADFQAAGKAWTLYGDEDAGDAPPRYALAGKDRKRIAFVALVPHPEAAYAWAKARQASGDKSATAKFDRWVWVLGVTDGSDRRIYAVYDALPTDERLIDDMRAALEGRIATLAVFDPKKGEYSDKSELVLPVSLGVILTRAKEAPEDDGDQAAAFRRESGRAVAKASGLVCPDQLAGFQRSGLAVTGPASGSFEVGCRYSGDRMRLAIFATRTQDLPAKDEILLSLAFMAPDALGKTMNDPPALGGATAGLYVGGAATMKDGERRALWIRRQNGWTIVIHAYYPAEGEPGMAAAASALAAAQGS